MARLGKASRLADHAAMIPRLKPAPSEAPRHFLREWRNYRGYTQDRLAEIVSEISGNERFSRDRISKFETHAEGIREELIYLFCNALAIEPAWFFRDPQAVEQELELLERVHGMTSDEIDAVRTASAVLKRLP